MQRRDRGHHTIPASMTQNSLRPPARFNEAVGFPERADQSDLIRRFAEKSASMVVERPRLHEPERFTDIDLGNRDLPVYQFKEAILDSVAHSQVTICVAETGAGKSTQIPQYLCERGYEVTMTQPRRLAARMVSEQIDAEIHNQMGVSGKGLVGYHTAEKNTVTEQTRMSVVTDGLRLVEELNERGLVENEVLVIDEVHERNKNIDVLMAWVRRSLHDNPKLRVVIMSATVDAHKIASYLANDTRPNVIEIPGRNYGVEKSEAPDSTVVNAAVQAVKDDNNTLIFLPGLREIEDTMDELRDKLYGMGRHDVAILPLHSNMSEQEQAAVKRAYPGPKIICATNVAQTSITIPDVDVVIDSGLERRIEIDQQGVESLRLHNASRADLDQRAGRCGRTKPGQYVLTRLNADTGFVPYINRDEYPTPEILRTNLDSTVLSVAGAGLNFRKLELLDSVSKQSITRSMHALNLLGALDKNEEITQRGRRMNKFPVRPSLARMLVYAEENNYTAEAKAYIAAMVASMEVGELPNYAFNAGNNWRRISDERDSDLLAQLDMFIFTQDHYGDKRKLKENDLSVRNVERAHELSDKLIYRMHVQRQEPLQPLTGDSIREEIKEAITAGMIDFVYEAQGGEYRRALTNKKVGEFTLRTISDRSLVQGNSRLIVGTPWTIPPQPGHDTEKHILQGNTKITTQMLGRVASDALITWRDGEIVWHDGRPKQEQRKFFRDEIALAEYREVDVESSAKLTEAIVDYAMKNPGSAQKELRKIKRELERLQRLTTEELPQLTQDTLQEMIQSAARSAASPGELDARLREEMVTIYKDLNFSEEKRANIIENSPDRFTWGPWTLKVGYQKGVPRAVEAKLRDVIKMTQPPVLPDGREILFVDNKKLLTLNQLREKYGA